MEADVCELIAQALAAVTPRAEDAKEELSKEAGLEGPGTERGVTEMQERAADDGAIEPSGERAEVEGVEDWMWEWRGWHQVAPGEPSPAGLVYGTELNAGTSCDRLRHGWTLWRERGAEALTSGLWRPFVRGRIRRRR